MPVYSDYTDDRLSASMNVVAAQDRWQPLAKPLAGGSKVAGCLAGGVTTLAVASTSPAVVAL
jgi:hypothetical protein